MWEYANALLQACDKHLIKFCEQIDSQSIRPQIKPLLSVCYIMKYALPNIVFFAYVIEKFEIIKQMAVTFDLFTAVTVHNNDVWVVTPSGLVEIYVR
jgi:hypothetical protein